MLIPVTRNRFRIALFYWFVISIPSLFLRAQAPNIKFNRLSIDDGLSNSYVTCILQDKQGFMWFGTQDGLNRYDGYDFTVYSHDPSVKGSLSDNYIRSMVETKDGILWIGTENGGLNKFDPAKETFTYFQHEPENPNSLSHNTVSVIYEDPDSTNAVLWIGTDGNGLTKFDPETNTFTHFKYDPNNINTVRDNRVRAIHKDRTGDYWIGTLNGLSRIKMENGKIGAWLHYLYDKNNPNSLRNAAVYSILEDRDGILWFGTLDGIHQLNRGDPFSFTSYQESSYPSFTGDDVQALCEDRSGVIWIGTFHGAKRFDSRAEEFSSYQNDSGDPRSLSDNNVTTIYKDRSGLLWLGTRGSGISIVNRSSEQFQHYFHNPNNINSLSNPSVRGIYEDQDGILWVGGYKGLTRIDRTTGQFTRYRGDETNGHQLDSDLIYVIIGDTKNDSILWIGSEGDGLYRFDKYSGSVKKYLQYEGDIQTPGVDYLRGSRFVFDLYLDPEGILWIATEGGLHCLDTKTENLTSYQHIPGNTYSLSSNKIRVIYEDKRGFLWIGTESNGLNRFDRKTKQFTRIQQDPDKLLSVSNNRIKTIHEDHNGTLWIGTNGGGLNRLVPSDIEESPPIFKNYTEKDGLSNDVIYGILEDEQGKLWLSTNGGLSCFTPETGAFRNFDVNDGLQSIEFNTGSYFKSQSGEMFFGGINGFNAFYPSQVKEYPYTPPVVLTDFQIFNESVPIGKTAEGSSILQSHISGVEEISLSYKDDVFSFEFAALSFAAPVKNKYAYKMEGFDKDWVYTDAEKRFATYTHLDPGEYIFRVKGSNQDGVWNEAGAAVGITITPPPWETWWAYTLYLMALMSAITGYVSYRTRKQTEELKRQQEIVENLQQIDALKDETLQIQEKYRRLFEQSRHAVFINTREGRFIDMNQSMLDLFGYSRTEFMELNSRELYALPGEQSGFRTEIESQGSVKDYEVKLRKNDGTVMDCLVTATVTRDDSEAITGYQGIIRDITASKQAAEALKEKTMYLDNILRSATEYAIATTDLDYRITYYNPMAEKIHGYNADEAIGKTVQEIHTGEKVAPERFEQAIENIRLHGEHCYIVEKETDEGIRYIDTRVSGIYDSNGELVGFSNFARDITESKLAEEEIHKLSRAVEQSSSMVLITDTDGHIEYVNPSFTEVTGFTLEEVVGKTPRILKSGVQSPEIYKKLWDTIKAGDEWKGEFHNKKKNGELFWGFCSISPVRDADGNTIHFIGIEEDITERKEGREEFAQKLIASQEQERKRIASELHDSLGQDLLVIKNRALMGLQIETIDDQSAEQFREISSIIDETLKGAQEISYNLRPYQLDRLGLTETIKSTLYRIEDSSEIYFKMECDDIDGVFDKDKEINIFRIIQECLNNILKHSEAERAYLGVKRDEKTIHINVKDDGKGFNADEFTGFHSKALGFGLMGLTERVRILNGTYEIKSAPSQGTKIRINIPIERTSHEKEKISL